MGDAGGQQREGVEAFGFEGFRSFRAGAGEVAHQHDVAEVGAGLALFVDRSEVEVEKPVFRIENLEIPAERATGFAQGVPIQAPHLRRQLLADRAVWIEAEELAGGAVDKPDDAVRVEDDDALAEGFEDFFEKALFADEAGDNLLDFARFNAVEAGDKFFEEAGFHGRVGKRAVVW